MTITSSGQVRDRRVHVFDGSDWARRAATDFWVNCSPGEQTTATVAGLRTLDGGGWTVTSVVEYAGSGGDFLSSTDDDPSSFHFNAASDLLQSPVMFGSYAHARMVQELLGAIPTELNLETYVQFLDATNDEEGSEFGFVEGGGSIITAADALACVYSDGTNYRLRSGAAETAAGAVDDTAWHLWRIKINATGCWFYMDGTLQNSTLLALEADEWPVSFGIGVQAAGANFMKMAWAHIWYA